MSTQLDRLESAVKKTAGILESGRLFVSGIADRIRNLFPDNAKADALASELEAKADAFAAALAANQTLPGEEATTVPSEDASTPAGEPVDVEPTPADSAPTDGAAEPTVAEDLAADAAREK